MLPIEAAESSSSPTVTCAGAVMEAITLKFQFYMLMGSELTKKKIMGLWLVARSRH